MTDRQTKASSHVEILSGRGWENFRQTQDVDHSSCQSWSRRRWEVVLDSLSRPVAAALVLLGRILAPIKFVVPQKTTVATA
jgi:hypothetical protein